MKLIYRYIIRKCFFNTTALLFAFAMIYAVVQAIQELNSVGKGAYTTLSMFIYLGALLPSYIYLLIPLAVLIGVMTTMLGLVKNSEYAIIRTSGISLKDIVKILGIFGIIFAIITFLLGEIIAPKASEFAKIYKLNKTEQNYSMELSSGLWSKDGANRIINVNKVNQNDTQHIFDIETFTYNESNELKTYITSPEASYDKKSKAWIFQDATIYTYLVDRIKINKETQYKWFSNIEPSYFAVLVVSAEEMPALDLIKYISHLKNNKESTNRHEIALWSKLLYPISCISMALIAIGFIPNNGRNINLSTKLFGGILIGVAFFFINKLVGFMATLYMWNPILSAAIPTIILFGVGWVIILKKES